MKKLLFFSTIILCFSCYHKFQEDTAPSITFDSPANHQELKSGDKVHISGKVTCLVNLAEVQLKVTPEGSSTDLFKREWKTSVKSFSFDTTYTATATSLIEHEIELEATNEKGETSQTGVHVHVQP